MKNIIQRYGPFNKSEIAYYLEQVGMEPFQKELIFNLFYKYFGDPISIKSINKEQYIMLLIVAKRILLYNNMRILPYILSGKVKRMTNRKNVNKKEYNKLINSELFEQIRLKYRSEKIEKYILSLISTILASEFEMVDYYDKDLDGRTVDIIPDIVCEEILMYIILI